MKQRYDRLVGMCDILPGEAARRQAVQERLALTLGSFGYRLVEVPVLERADLFLKKTGEELAARMYSFDYKNRRLCLRPEFTSAIGRLFIDKFSTSSLPVRLQYGGPVFRIDGPIGEGEGSAKKDKRHQFAQVGIELLGAAGSPAEAEVVAAACRGLDNISLKQYHIVLGHMGTVGAFLQNLKLDPRAVNLLLSKMEELAHRERSVDQLEEALGALYPDLAHAHNPIPEIPDAAPRFNLPELPISSRVDETDTRAVISSFLDGIRIDFGDAQQQDEIVERLLLKLQHRSQSAGLREALNFITELSALQGPINTAYAALTKFIDRHKISHQPLEELMAVARLLIAQDIPAERIYINLALSRGLQYYTGMIFDLYSDVLPEGSRLGGGGRYDDLIGLLGGDEIPACGFSYMLEPLLRALDAEETSLIREDTQAPQVYVAILQSAETESAFVVANQLRQQGLRVITSLAPELDLATSWQNAAGAGAKSLVLVTGNATVGSNKFTLFDLRMQNDGTIVSADDLFDTLLGILNGKERA